MDTIPVNGLTAWISGTKGILINCYVLAVMCVHLYTCDDPYHWQFLLKKQSPKWGLNLPIYLGVTRRCIYWMMWRHLCLFLADIYVTLSWLLEAPAIFACKMRARCCILPWLNEADCHVFLLRIQLCRVPCWGRSSEIDTLRLFWSCVFLVICAVT
jgi:hypothetical protein